MSGGREGDRPDSLSESATQAAVETREDPLLTGFSRERRVMVAGGSGFVGGHLFDRLSARGHRVRAVSRTGAPEHRPSSRGVRWVRADVTRESEVRGLAEDCDVLVHLAGIRQESPGSTYRGVHVEGTRNLLAEATRAGAGRFVFMSALGATLEAHPFFASKAAAEDLVRRSGIDWTIFRPAAIFGPDDHFMAPTARWLRHWPLFLVPAGRDLTLRPVAVEDVADALTQSVERDDLAGETYCLAGPDVLTLEACVRTVARVLQLRRWVRSVSPELAERLLTWTRRAGLPSPSLAEGWRLLCGRPESGAGPEDFRETFQVEPLPFREALEDYL